MKKNNYLIQVERLSVLPFTRLADFFNNYTAFVLINMEKAVKFFSSDLRKKTAEKLSIRKGMIIRLEVCLTDFPTVFHLVPSKRKYPTHSSRYHFMKRILYAQNEKANTLKPIPYQVSLSLN